MLPPPIFGNSSLSPPPIFGNSILSSPPVFNVLKNDDNFFNDPVPKNNLKTIFIDDIYPKDYENSIFSKLEKNFDFELNFEDFEDNFIIKKRLKKEEEKIKKIETDYILNQQKVNNISIALYKFNYTIEELINSLKENKKNILIHENFEILQRIFPNQEDIKLLKNHDLENSLLILCKTEEFLIKLVKIPFIKKIIDINFLKEDIFFLLKRIKKIEKFKEPFTLLIKNRNFKTFIVIMLRFVNFLNHGSKHRNKKGLSFKNILRISKFSGNNKKKNIMYFSVKTIFAKNNKYFHFSEDIVNLILDFNGGIDELYSMKINLIEKIKNFSNLLNDFEKNEFFPYLEILEDLKEDQKNFKIKLFDILEEFNDLDSKFEVIKDMYILKKNYKKQTFLKEFFEINKNILDTIKFIKKDVKIEKKIVNADKMKKLLSNKEKNMKKIEKYKNDKKEIVSKYKKQTISNSKIISEKKN